MPTPVQIVHERITSWHAVLANGDSVKDKFPAGKAQVRAKVAPYALGDQSSGMTRLEQKLVAAVKAAQQPGTRIEVTIKAGDNLGLTASCLVTGPAV